VDFGNARGWFKLGTWQAVVRSRYDVVRQTANRVSRVSRGSSVGPVEEIACNGAARTTYYVNRYYF